MSYTVRLGTENRTWYFHSGLGVFNWGSSSRDVAQDAMGWQRESMDAIGRGNRLRIALSISNDGFRLELPYWIVLVTSAVPIVLRGLRRMVVANRRWHLEDCARRGVCAVCGYDLRATPERCPECGRGLPHEADVTQ